MGPADITVTVCNTDISRSLGSGGRTHGRTDFPLTAGPALVPESLTTSSEYNARGLADMTVKL